ncbi:hypothetical protein PG994_013174 [Apiospora phragmitis]|uniref:Uncharacterized protein n=1 Tax=Apiospora phragmitis TaxID=2905665 RepID=A0ABR1T7W9_9PEZI
MFYDTQTQPREHDQSFWITHFRQRGYKRPGQQQQQRSSGIRRHGGNISSIISNSNGEAPNNPGKVFSPPSYLSPNHPRPFGHIESERQHLQYLLGEQDRRACELFSRIAAVDEAYSFGSVHEHRQARKDRAWLQRRIDETIDREKGILVRLGEIHVEIQCRERWHMVEQQRAFLRQEGGHQQYGWGWDGRDTDLSNWSQCQRGSAASPRHHRHNLGPSTVSSYAQQQQHVWSANPHYSSMAAGTWANAPEWYPYSTTPTGMDRRRHRSTSGGQDAGQVRLLAEENPAYLSNAGYTAESGERLGPSRGSVLPDSRLPDRRRSLPTMHYNWDGGGSGGGRGHQCLGYIAEE